MGETQCVIEIAGKVQLVGFRNFVEANARTLGLEGLVFNDRNGRVKILCGGPETKIDALLQLIELGSSEIGAVIESMEKREIPVHLPLPPTFFKEPTVELMDIKDRLDDGVDILKSMDKKLGVMGEKLGALDKLDTLEGMDKKLGAVDQKLGGMDKKLGTLDKLDTLEGMDKKLGTLEEIKRILAKMAVK